MASRPPIVVGSSGLGQPLTHVDIDEIDRIQQEEINAGHYSGGLLTSKQRQTMNASRPWEQVVTDEQGRRRFHGAFTGGFSAGYFNTVGTEEGWTPSTFVSSRRSKKDRTGREEEEEEKHDGSSSSTKQERHQRISDFMDEEDYNDGIGGNVIGSTTVTTTHHGGESSSTTRLFNDNSPVEVRERIGLAIMRSQGWREGMLVGEISRLFTRRPSVIDKEANEGSRKRKVYTVCSLPPHLRSSLDDDEERDEKEEEVEHRNIQALYRCVDRSVHNHKNDMHGIGYSGELKVSGVSTGANELLSSIFGPSNSEGGPTTQSTIHHRRDGSSSSSRQQQGRGERGKRSTQAVGAFGIGVFDQEEGGDGYDVEVYNEYDNSSLPNRGGTSRYATTVVEIDDDDDTLIGDRGHHSAEVINLIDDEDHKGSRRPQRCTKRVESSSESHTLDGMFTNVVEEEGDTCSTSEDVILSLSNIIPKPPRVPRGFNKHLHVQVSGPSSDGDVLRDTSPEYQRLVEWLDSNPTVREGAITMTERTSIISAEPITRAPDHPTKTSHTSEANTKQKEGESREGKALWAGVNDDVRREALLAAVGGRTISMHKASSSSSSSHDTSRPSLEALNRDPDKRRRYEVFCAQMASGAPTLSANNKVDFNELKEFTKLYEYSREEGSTLDVTNTQGKDSKSTRRKASPEEIAEALRKLQPSRLECNWRAEPLVCKRFGCPDPWRHKKFYDDSDILSLGKKSRWAGGDRQSRYNRNTSRPIAPPSGHLRASPSEKPVESPQPRVELPPELPLPMTPSKRPPDDLFTDIFGG